MDEELFAEAFETRIIGEKNCSDTSPKGRLSARYDYILKSLTGDIDYPKLPYPACIPYIHYNIRAGNIRANTQIIAPRFQGRAFYGTFYGTLNGRATGNKSFDITHPTKTEWRLRHTCLEGPENAVFYRGRITNSNVIDLPEYWEGLVNPESITVSLTQIGYSQDLIVEKIEEGKRILIKSGNSANIDCYYLIHATRKDTEDLIPEYKGTTPADYPGNNDYYSVAGYNYDVREGDIQL
jgi:hypothetical protein